MRNGLRFLAFQDLGAVNPHTPYNRQQNRHDPYNRVTVAKNGVFADTENPLIDTIGKNYQRWIES